MTKFVAFYQTLDDGIKRQSEIEANTLEEVSVIFRNTHTNCVLNEIGVPYDSRYVCDND